MAAPTTRATRASFRHRQPQRQPPDHPVLLRGCAAEQRGRPDRGAQGMFYGSAQDNGFPQSDPNVIQPGQQATATSAGSPARRRRRAAAWPPTRTDWAPSSSTSGRAAAATTPTSSRSTASAGPTGLVRNINPPGSQVPDPQWPFVGVVNFAVNPLNGDQIVISSAEGRILPDREPPASSGCRSPSRARYPRRHQCLALAYGAPDPTRPAAAPRSTTSSTSAPTAATSIVTLDGGGTGTLDGHFGRPRWIARPVDRDQPEPGQPRGLRGHPQACSTWPIRRPPAPPGPRSTGPRSSTAIQHRQHLRPHPQPVRQPSLSETEAKASL